jgi:hypothetical protein
MRQDFALKVSLPGFTPDSKGIYTLPANTPVRFVIESPHDVHVGIWSLQEDGVLQLLPNQDEEDTLVRAGVSRVVPGNRKYEIVSEAANQIEVFRIVASTVPWQPLPLRAAEGPFPKFPRGQGLDDWEDQQAQLMFWDQVDPVVAAQGMVPLDSLSVRWPQVAGALAVAYLTKERGVKFRRLTKGIPPLGPAKEKPRVAEVVLPYRVR